MSKKQNTKAELPQGVTCTDQFEVITPQADKSKGLWSLNPKEREELMAEAAKAGVGPAMPDMDEHDPLLAAYNDGDGNQTAQAQHSPLPAKWHDCEVAEKQIKLLQQQANQAQALAEALKEIKRETDESRDFRSAAMCADIAHKALANWEAK